jgi:hypothetical protein
MGGPFGPWLWPPCSRFQTSVSHLFLDIRLFATLGQSLRRCTQSPSSCSCAWPLKKCAPCKFRLEVQPKPVQNGVQVQLREMLLRALPVRQGLVEGTVELVPAGRWRAEALSSGHFSGLVGGVAGGLAFGRVGRLEGRLGRGLWMTDSSFLQNDRGIATLETKVRLHFTANPLAARRCCRRNSSCSQKLGVAPCHQDWSRVKPVLTREWLLPSCIF